MKRTIVLSLFAALALSCSKEALDTFPSNKVPADVVYGDVENAKAALTGSLARLGSAGWTSGYNSGMGFGITESYLTGDALAEDYVLSASGSGWMWQTYAYNLKNWFDDPRLQCHTDWNCYYTTINGMNGLIGSAELLSETPEGKSVLGQAYVLRAFSYHMLAQLFARAYFYYPDDLCVPVYIEPTTSETKGQPRSTNREVYEEVIVPDLTNGIALLKEALEAGVRRSNKTEVDYFVANGIKARVALTMHRWSDAYTAAEEALKGAATRVLPAAQLASGMNDIMQLGSVLWGEIKTPDNYGMYASFQSQMDAGHDGYAKSARRCCTKYLWTKLGQQDARRAWWMGDFDNADYAKEGETIKYCQRKFKFQGSSWLGDYIYMRAEEMLLTAAEAYCQEGNDVKAREFLGELMAQRDPAYKGAAKSGNSLGRLTSGSDGAAETGSLLEEIINQRRIELWGEYGRLYDIKRLGQGFKRTAPEAGDNPDFSAAALLGNRDTQSPGTFAWVLLIPQVELDGNSEIIQNPLGDTAE